MKDEEDQDFVFWLPWLMPKHLHKIQLKNKNKKITAFETTGNYFQSFKNAERT